MPTEHDNDSIQRALGRLEGTVGALHTRFDRVELQGDRIERDLGKLKSGSAKTAAVVALLVSVVLALLAAAL